MANELDELSGPVNGAGRDANVIEKQIPVKTGAGSVFFQILLWVLFIVPGIVFTVKKINAKAYLDKLQQKIQHDASQIDNYLEQRVVILSNCAKLLDRAVDLDKTTFTQIAAYRAGGRPEDDAVRNDVANKINSVADKISIAFENYPELKAHNEIADAMQQNAYLQKEITAARELYNDSVAIWNTEIFKWPTKKIVAAKNGYTTRIPFTASAEMKAKARDVFF